MLRGSVQRESGAQRIEFTNGARIILSCGGRGQNKVKPRTSHSNAAVDLLEVADGPSSAASFTVLSMLTWP